MKRFFYPFSYPNSVDHYRGLHAEHHDGNLNAYAGT